MIKIKYGYFIILAAGLLLTVGCDTPAQHQSSRPVAALSPAALQSLKPQAEEIVQAALQHPNPVVRTHAIEVVVTTQHKDMMADIIRLMEDPLMPVRFAATTAAGDMLCYGCEQHIRKRLEDEDENVRVAAAYSLLKLNYPEYHEYLRQAAQSKDQTIRANALMLLGKNGNRDDLDLLYQAMRDEIASDQVKIQAIDAIAQLKDTRLYRSKLWALLISKYADDRVMGIRSMGALGTLDAQNAIITMLTDDVLEVRLCAAEQLGRLGDSSGREEVARYLQTHPDLSQSDMATMLAVMAIGYIGTPDLTAYLPKALKSPSEDIRLAAAQSILLLTKK
ncbi:MAG: HEAT repeat domain-containing protein [Planctomycetes bacterium]|nr:HEAT repeat domain-containing protein [Planctomycetota bacterium]